MTDPDYPELATHSEYYLSVIMGAKVEGCHHRICQGELLIIIVAALVSFYGPYCEE